MRNGYKRDELALYGAELGDPWLVEDNRVITSSCPKTAPDVAFMLLQQLTSKDMMIYVQTAMGFIDTVDVSEGK